MTPEPCRVFINRKEPEATASAAPVCFTWRNLVSNQPVLNCLTPASTRSMETYCGGKRGREGWSCAARAERSPQSGPPGVCGDAWRRVCPGGVGGSVQHGEIKVREDLLLLGGEEARSLGGRQDGLQPREFLIKVTHIPGPLDGGQERGLDFFGQ